MKIKMNTSAAANYEDRSMAFDFGKTYEVPKECPEKLAKELIRAGHAEAVKPEKRVATAPKPTTRAKK